MVNDFCNQLQIILDLFYQYAMISHQQQPRRANVTKVKPTVSYIKSLRVFGWGDFKHKLLKAGVIPTIDASVPQVWIDAFKKAMG